MISEIFPVSNIVLNLESEDKDELFEEMLEILLSSHPEINRSEALLALKEREEKMTTGIMPGVAAPHAICSSVDGVVGAIGISKSGIDYDALDDKPVKVVFMLLFAPTETERHLQIMKHFSGLLQYPDLYTSMIQKKSASEIFDLLRSCEEELEK